MSDSLQPPWTVAHQAPLSMGFSKQEYWSGLSSPSPGDLPDSKTEPRSPALQANSLPYEPFFTIWAILYQLSHKGSWSKLEWIAYPFSSGSSWPMNRTRVSALQADSLPAEPSGKPILFPKLDLQIHFLEDCFLWPPVKFRSAIKHAHDTCSSLVARITIETDVSLFDIHLFSPWSVSSMKIESGLTWPAIYPHYHAHCQGLRAHAKQVLTAWMHALKWV